MVGLGFLAMIFARVSWSLWLRRARCALRLARGCHRLYLRCCDGPVRPDRDSRRLGDHGGRPPALGGLRAAAHRRRVSNHSAMQMSTSLLSIFIVVYFASCSAPAVYLHAAADAQRARCWAACMARKVLQGRWPAATRAHRRARCLRLMTKARRRGPPLEGLTKEHLNHGHRPAADLGRDHRLRHLHVRGDGWLRSGHRHPLPVLPDKAASATP